MSVSRLARSEAHTTDCVTLVTAFSRCAPLATYGAVHASVALRRKEVALRGEQVKRQQTSIVPYAACCFFEHAKWHTCAAAICNPVPPHLWWAITGSTPPVLAITLVAIAGIAQVVFPVRAAATGRDAITAAHVKLRLAFGALKPQIAVVNPSAQFAVFHKALFFVTAAGTPKFVRPCKKTLREKVERKGGWVSFLEEFDARSLHLKPY